MSVGDKITIEVKLRTMCLSQQTVELIVLHTNKTLVNYRCGHLLEELNLFFSELVMPSLTYGYSPLGAEILRIALM